MVERNFSPAVQEASKAFSEAMAGGTDERNMKKSKVFDSSEYCHEQTKECFAKNLATLPYGKLKYLTSILSRNFSAAASHGMRFKTLSKLDSQVGAGASASTKQKFIGMVKSLLGRLTQAPFEMLQGLLGKFGMGEFNAGPESMKRSDLASHGNAFEPVLAGGDESTFTDRLAQPELEGYHPYMGYEAETPGCARSLSTYFEVAG